jgi:hypothetical protein
MRWSGGASEGPNGSVVSTRRSASASERLTAFGLRTRWSARVDASVIVRSSGFVARPRRCAIQRFNAFGVRTRRSALNKR